MKTVAIDTNSLLDYRLKRQPHFTQIKKIFEECLDGQTKIFIPNPVFLETEWVLRSYYKESKEQIVKFFQELLLLDLVVTKDKKEVELSLNLFKNTSGIGFTDCIILNQVQEFKPDSFLTFDEQLQKVYEEG